MLAAVDRLLLALIVCAAAAHALPHRRAHNPSVDRESMDLFHHSSPEGLQMPRRRSLEPNTTSESQEPQAQPQWAVVWLALKEWESEFIERVLLESLPLDAKEISPVAQCDPVGPCLAEKGIVVIVGRAAYEERAGQVESLLLAARERKLQTLVIHISDEQCNMATAWYPLATLVVRQYWCEPQSLGANVVTIPCGLRTGWNYTHGMLATGDRKCAWTFYGKVGGDRMQVRQSMKWEMDKVQGGCAPKTLGGQEDIGRAEFTEKMCSTVFAPCPRGHGLETFRFNEALECGGIPIVDDGGKVFHKYMPGILDHVITTDETWTHTISGHPLAEYVNDLLRDPIELERRRLGVMGWYHDYKRTLLNRIRGVIEGAGAESIDQRLGH